MKPVMGDKRSVGTRAMSEVSVNHERDRGSHNNIRF